MIELTGIRKAFDIATTGQVLKGLDLHIAAGEFVALLGKSGSGKTTLLNIIGGLDLDFQGRAVVNGEELQKMGDRSLSRFRNRTIAFVFQTFNLLPHLSCKENVAFPSFFTQTMPRREVNQRVQEAMARVDILHKANAYPNKLSGGEKQRVAIARAVFQSPKVLLADEPTGNLDSKSGGRIMDLFQKLNKEDGVTVVLVTHDEQAAARADRIVRIVDGTIADEGRAA